MFSSKTLLEHIVRGIVGIGGLALAMALAPFLGAFSLLFILVSLWAFRGCPMCWLTGLFEALARREPNSLCVDKTCSDRSHK